MACQSAPCQQASGNGLHRAKTGNFRNISAAFEKRKKRVNLEVECSHQSGKTPGKTPKDRLSRMLVRGKKVKANRDQGCGQEHRCDGIPTNRFLDYGSESGMSDWVSGNLVVNGDGEPGPLVTRHLQNHKREAQLKNHLYGDQASEGVVVSLLGRSEESRDQQNGYEACSTAQNLASTVKPTARSSPIPFGASDECEH